MSRPTPEPHPYDEVAQAAFAAKKSRWLDWHDLVLLEEMLRLTPAERLAYADGFNESIEILKGAKRR